MSPCLCPFVILSGLPTVILRESFASVILRESFASVILRESFALCHSEGAERLKNLAQDKLRHQRSSQPSLRFFALRAQNDKSGAQNDRDGIPPFRMTRGIKQGVA